MTTGAYLVPLVVINTTSQVPKSGIELPGGGGEGHTSLSESASGSAPRRDLRDPLRRGGGSFGFALGFFFGLSGAFAFPLALAAGTSR